MPAFEIRGGVREDGSWYLDVAAPDGSTVLHADVSRVLVLGLEHFTRAPGTRVPVISEVLSQQAARRLPDGWEPTLDGVNVLIDLGANQQRHTRNYRRGEEVVVAPCAVDGSPIPETREVLLAVDSQPEA